MSATPPKSSPYHIDPGRRLPSYRTTAGSLGMGPSLGNSELWANTKNTGDIERLFSVAHGRTVIGSIAIRFSIAGRPLRDAGVAASDGSAKVYTPLSLDLDDVIVEIHPAYVRRRFDVGGSIRITETVFLPLAPIHEATQSDPPVLYQIVQIENRGAHEQALRVTGYARLRGETPDDVAAVYDRSVFGLVAQNRGGDNPLRIFGLTREPSAYETSFDFGNVYSMSRTAPLSNATEASGDILGSLQVDAVIAPGTSERFAFKTGVYESADADVRKGFAAVSGAQSLEETLSALEDELHRAEVITPDDMINDGALWSKVNMRRVMARYPIGWLFTNDPGVMSNVVIRDCAWFVFGCDYFAPQFSRSLLNVAARLQYPNGKLPEYVDALSGRVEDDGLNINDDTPLFIMAANHHFRCTGDEAWLGRIFPALARAGHYIISQMDERNLVVCTADDPRGNVWAIAGWRNIIAHYSINGAVTEINAECAAALRYLSHLAERVSESDAEVRAFADTSAKIQTAMQEHLINPKNGLFYLNIDVRGNPHTDVTGDQVFPVMFDTCDDETGFRIIARLNSPDFRTEAGLRTASALDPRYDPAAFSGLLGGVWPGLTWWYAFAAARYHPEFMVNALRSSFEHYARDPRRHNTVPGQFSEWFDGDSLVNRGMRLSPWEPPRFLWAAIEGVCGLTLSGDRPEINPLVPANWKWVALRRLPFHGREISYFAVRTQGSLTLFTTCEVNTQFTHSLYETDVSDKVPIFSRIARVVALQRGDEIAVLVGNVSDATTNVPIDISELLEPGARYHVRVYNSERDEWETDSVQAREELNVTSLGIEGKGYRVMIFRFVGEGADGDDRT
ncbi:MAG: amylo-alpha-1,6-glucosidase [Candidatus Tumulicola sp.]